MALAILIKWQDVAALVLPRLRQCYLAAVRHSGPFYGLKPA